MFVAVAMGAFGAHALKSKLTPDLLTIFETGVRYQVYHALALLLVGYLANTYPRPLITAAGISFVSGIFIFSGSLYVLALTGVRTWGAVTPMGGLAFLVGWVLLLLLPL